MHRSISQDYELVLTRLRLIAAGCSGFSASWDSTTLLSLTNPNPGVNYTEYAYAVTGA
jgi:hypothetical protein